MAGKSEAHLVEPSIARQPVDREAADVALAREGDREAFERLYRLHVPRIYALARRMAAFELAEDLTQDVFVRAWEKLGSFRGDSQFGTWLYRLAINVIIEVRRKGKRWQAHDDSEAVLGQLTGVPQNLVFAIDFEAAVSRLPASAREVFVLHDVEGYKHREIGQLVRITSGTSKGQLHRARMILRRHLLANRGPSPGAKDA
jgi:RNA polymerase sigma-70 factor (ECF subfamily)